jgi:hypothetical protein
MTDHDPLDELIGNLRTDEPEVSDEVFAVGRARLQALVEPVPVPDVVAVPPPRKRLFRGPIASAAAVVVLAAGVLFVQAARTDSPAPAASAAATLNSAADNIKPVDEPIEPGQYRYVVSHSWDQVAFAPLSTDQFFALQEWVVEKWVPADPAQLCTVRRHFTGNHEWQVGDEERARKAGVVLQEPSTTEESMPCIDGEDWSRFLSADVASLPHDPGKLYDLLRHMPMPVPIGQEGWVLNRVTAALFSGRAPAALRAALYRALALEPGLEVTEQGAILDGHQGTALGITSDGTRHDVIIDPDTGQFIGARTVIVESDDRGVPPGTIFSSRSVTNPVVVDEVGETR